LPADSRKTDLRQAKPGQSELMNVSSPDLSKRKTTLFTAVNLATLGFILAWLTFDWYAISYLVSH
jgi:hypothetical protein